MFISHPPGVAQACEDKRRSESHAAAFKTSPIEKNVSATGVIRQITTYAKSFSGKITKTNLAFVKPIASNEKAPSFFVKAILSIQSDTVKASSTDKNNKATGNYSKTAFTLFLIAMSLLLVGIILGIAIAYSPQGGFLAGLLTFAIAAIFAGLIDAFAFISAIIGMVHNEDKKILAEIVFYVNIALIVLILILALTQI